MRFHNAWLALNIRPLLHLFHSDFLSMGKSHGHVMHHQCLSRWWTHDQERARHRGGTRKCPQCQSDHQLEPIWRIHLMEEEDSAPESIEKFASMCTTRRFRLQAKQRSSKLLPKLPVTPCIVGLVFADRSLSIFARESIQLPDNARFQRKWDKYVFSH